MTHLFLIAFSFAGIYYIIKGIRLRVKLDPNADDFEHLRNKAYKYICGGILFIVIAIIKFYSWIVLWGRI